MLTRRSVLLTPAALSLVAAHPKAALALDVQNVRPRSEIASLFVSLDRLVIIARIANGIAAPMIFDTGTSGSAIDTPYVTALNLQKTGDAITIDGATGKPLEDRFLTTLPDVSLGGIAVGDQDFAVYSHPSPNEAGIVGPYIFGDKLVCLELSHDRLRVRDKSRFTLPTGASYPYLPDERPGITVEGPGFSVLGLMDTGHTGSLTLPLAMAASLPLEKAPTVIGAATSVGGTQPIYGARMKGAIRVGPLVITDPELQFYGQRVNVGLRLLRQMTIVMDPVGKRSWATTPDRRAASPLSNYAGRYDGIEIRVEGERLIYQRDGRAPRLLTPYDGDLFDFANDPVVQIQFVRNEKGIVGFDIIERTLTAVDRTG